MNKLEIINLISERLDSAWDKLVIIEDVFDSDSSQVRVARREWVTLKDLMITIQQNEMEDLK